MTRGIGSSGYNPQVTGAGSNKRTGSAGSAGSGSSAGSTQRGSVFGSFGSVGSAGSTGSAGSAGFSLAEQKADKAHCEELYYKTRYSPEHKAWSDASDEYNKLVRMAKKDGKIEEQEQEMIDKAAQKLKDLANALSNSAAYKAYEEAAAAYVEKYSTYWDN